MAIVLAYRAGSDAADEASPSETESSESSESTGLPGAEQIYDPLTTVEGSEYDGELYIFRGYERTYVGAVSAATNWLTAYGSSLDPAYSEQLGAELLVDDGKQTPEDWRDYPLNRREEIGLTATEAVPDGWALSASPVAYQTRNASADRIEVILLTRLVAATPYGSESVNTLLTMDLVWTGTDWADSGNDMGADYTTLKVEVGEEASSEAKELGWKLLTR
ncbi:hypothetical protein [Glycomyces salinus]|uniref:hypothetical protein n=1 Tax=Glycomyces salinus TaxID=980294 RepID=UPI0018EBFD66|nr:hypothetical protein [Glycomyces salinus]